MCIWRRTRPDCHDCPRDELLVQGAGGVIYHAKWRGLDVVAKMLRPEGDRDSNIARQVARNDLINEICLLSHLRHPCLVMFLGAVLSPADRSCQSSPPRLPVALALRPAFIVTRGRVQSSISLPYWATGFVL